MSLVRFRFWARRCSSMVEHQPSKLNTWVRFPSPALKMNILFIMREWLSWWSTTLPRSGSRVRVPSRALLIYKRYPKRIPFVYKRVLPDSNGSYLRSTSVGANGSPLDFQHPVSHNEGFRRTRTFEVSALLRSVQNRHPPDVVHRLALFLYTKGILKGYLLYINESCRTRTVRIFVPLRSVLTEVHWTSSTPSRAMKDFAGLERFVSSFHFGRCRIVFF